MKFILLFCVTVAMVLVAVYFNFKIPEKENQVLRDELKTIKTESEYQNTFFTEMIVLHQMIDSLGMPGQNTSYENSRISAKIVELQKNIPPKSSTHVYDMHMAITQLYVELQNAKNRLNGLEQSETLITEYEMDLEKCKAELTQTKRELYIARRIN